jgi:PBP1b-binding outer membrane lipoprotein LpoB
MRVTKGMHTIGCLCFGILMLVGCSGERNTSNSEEPSTSNVATKGTGNPRASKAASPQGQTTIVQTTPIMGSNKRVRIVPVDGKG